MVLSDEAQQERRAEVNFELIGFLRHEIGP
jgi:hypothetical protein